jgi:hypothetical protein
VRICARIAVVVIAACSGLAGLLLAAHRDNASGELTASSHEAELEPTPDPKYLVARLSDLPPGFSVVPGETFPTRLRAVLAEPWSAGYERLLRQERVAGYQTSFRTPEQKRIESSAAVYRSRGGAEEVFRLRTKRFRAFLEGQGSGLPAQVERIGDETAAFRFRISGSRGVTVAWRYRNVLASCTSLGRGVADVDQLLQVASGQQKRISNALE